MRGLSGVARMLLLLAAVLSRPCCATLVSGTVVDANGELPIGDAAITVSGGDYPGPYFNAATTTDASGHYALDVPVGPFRVTADAHAYVSQFQDLSAGSDPLVVDFMLEIGGTLKGTVRATASSTALANERIVLLDGSNTNSFRETRTQDDGTFVFDGLPANQYGLCVFDDQDAYVDACFDGKLFWPPPAIVTFDNFTPISIALGQTVVGVDIGLQPNSSISGTVFDSYLNSPIALKPVGFVLYRSDQSQVLSKIVTTDADGGFTLPDLPAGSYYLEAGVDVDYAILNSTYNYRIFGGDECLPSCNFASASLIQLTDYGTGGIDFNLFPVHVVMGSVTDATTAQGIANVTVNACDFFPNKTVATTITDATGHYTLSHVHDLGRVATIDAPAHRNVVWPNSPPDVAGQGCETLAGNMLHFSGPDALLSGINFSLQPAAAVSGRVTASQAPSAGVSSHVSLIDATIGNLISTIQTDSSGHYTSVGVPPGSYFVVAYINADDCQFYNAVACSGWGVNYPAAMSPPTPIVLTGTDIDTGIDLQLNVRIFSSDFEFE